MVETTPLTADWLRPLLAPVSRWATRRSLTAVRLGAVGVVLSFLAAVWFSGGDRRGAAVGSVLLLAVLLNGAVTAELAGGGRARPAPETRWLLDLLAHAREYVVYIGLAVGGTVAGVPLVWGWAAVALAAHGLWESVRASTAGAADRWRDGDHTARARRSPIEEVDPSRTGERATDDTLLKELLGDGPEPAREPSSPPPAREAPATRARPAGWFRRTLMFGQDARFAVVAVTVTVGDARVTFVALIVGAFVAVVADLLLPVPGTGNGLSG